MLHVPFEELPQILNDSIGCLKPNGILYASFKYGDRERDKEGRFFCDINEERWQLVELKLQSAEHLKIWQTIDNRVARQEIWLNVLLQHMPTTID